MPKKMKKRGDNLSLDDLFDAPVEQADFTEQAELLKQALDQEAVPEPVQDAAPEVAANTEIVHVLRGLKNVRVLLRTGAEVVLPYDITWDQILLKIDSL